MSRVPLSHGEYVTSDELEEERKEVANHSFVDADKKTWFRRCVNAFALAFSGPVQPMFMDRRFQMRGFAKWALKRAMKACKQKGHETTTIFVGGQSYTVVPTKDYISLKTQRDVMLRSPRN